jgi:hypothetical protein
MSTQYKAPWSRSLILISVMATIVCLGSALMLLVRGHGSLPWLSLAPLALLAGCALFTIRGYSIMDDAVLVHRLFWATRLPVEGLNSARFEPQAMRGSVRTFGNGGLFSFSGHYQNKALGPYRAFVTDRRQTIVLRYSGRTIVLSPAAPEQFIAALPKARSAG